MHAVGKATVVVLLALLFFGLLEAAGQQAPAPIPAQPPTASKQTAPTQASKQPAQPVAQVHLAGEVPPNDQRATLLWSVTLAADAPAVLPTEAEFAGTRSAVIAGDRVVALFQTDSELSHGGRPIHTFRLLSLDLKTGEVKGQKDIQGQKCPYLFASSDDHLILGHTSLTCYNPDLTESGEKFVETGHGRTMLISPDGSVLAHETGAVTELLDAHTLSPTGVRIAEPEAAAVSLHAVLSADARWASQFPRDLTFVTLIDVLMPHLVYRGPCGGQPAFLAEDKILFIGCGKVTVIDSSGKLLKEFPLPAAKGSFAGVSRNGSRFAIVSSDYSIGDPSYKPDELFTIYNSENFESVATVALEKQDEARSWSAFSADGSFFLCGSPRKLNLYRIP
ncbi:MAG: hypothetical protein ABR906_11770 [Terracidiphilus sp.]